MTVMDNEDPALPETTEGEAWYDAEIAPALAELAKRCHKRGMAFVAVVEYEPGHRAGTYYMTEEAGLEMTMQHFCAMTAPNVDAYVMNLKRHCDAQDIDTGGSFALEAGVAVGKVTCPRKVLEQLAAIQSVDEHDNNGPGRVVCPVCDAWMSMRWSAGERKDDATLMTHSDVCAAEWARKVL